VLWAGSAAIALACAGTIKPTLLLIVLPPMLYEGWRNKRLAVVALVIAFAGALTLSWGEHDRALLTAANPSWYAVNSQRLIGPVDLLFDTNYAHSLAERAGFILLPPLTVGLIASSRALQIRDAWWWLWLLGGLLSLVVFTRLNSEHFYYQLPIVPALAALAAAGAPRWPRRVSLRIAAVLLLLSASFLGATELYRANPVYYHAGRALARVAKPGAPVVALSSYGASAPWLPMVLYYAHHKGWNLGPYASARDIDSLPGGRAACDLVVVADGPLPTQLPAGWTVTARTAEYTLGRRLTYRCQAAFGTRKALSPSR
jgi:hypothetical protein